MVVVHGIGKEYLGPRTLHGPIAPAVLDGVGLAEGPSLALEDIEAAFYGHLFRPSGVKGSAESLTEPYEVELLQAMWAEAARAEPDRVPPPPGPAERSKAQVPRPAQRALYALSRSRFLARTADRFLIGVLAQLRRYLTEPDIHARAQDQIAAAVKEDTRVLVGHSLGSVVAYEALCAHPEWPVTTFVSIGSPLGIPYLVFERLRPTPQKGRGCWPAGVRTWTNLCDAYDVVALVKQLAPLFGDGSKSVNDVPVHNGWQAHSIERHLTAVETGTAIAAGLTT
ncbi:hypothetical protein FPZ41_30675 [Streptomyces sp. K1PN6]|uniref:Alpha/beta hydrolase n=1 Tax=Streptomyces acidicola TaxID=2596892 RepID=A0A5N8WZK5_9ACTN|nr:hypothetical protein [Streptomyces acidicola]